MNKYTDYYYGKEPTDCWIDGHCHLCNEPLSDNYLEEIEEARESNIRIFISTALNRDEIEWHLQNSAPEIKLIAGIHPFYDKSNIKDFAYLAEQCQDGNLWGIGEIGYDNRKNNHNYQKGILYQQLELAREFDLPVVFHVVHRYNELYQTLKNDFPEIRGYIHGFNGSIELVEMLCKLDIGFSIGYKMLQNKEAALIIRRILKHGLIMFETDSPFQKMPGRGNSEKYLIGLSELFEQISSICDVHTDILLDKQWRTYQKMKI